MGKQRVPRTRAGETWTEARYWSFIRSALRGAWNRYPVKFQYLRDNRRTRKKTNASKRTTYEYRCEACKKWKDGKDVQVDHIQPAGSLNEYGDLPGFVERLFCEADNLQVLCKGCHGIKTKEERDVKRKQTATKSSK